MQKRNKLVFLIVALLLIAFSTYLMVKHKPWQFKCGNIVRDHEGNSYKTIEIGDKCWMNENLKSQKDGKGEKVQRKCYDNKIDNCDARGGLYTSKAVMNGESKLPMQGICPRGWHLPVENVDFKRDAFLKMNLQRGGSCELVCDYQACKDECNQIGCSDSLAYLNADALFGTLKIGSCKNEDKGKIEESAGSFSMSISLRCVKNSKN